MDVNDSQDITGRITGLDNIAAADQLGELDDQAIVDILARISPARAIELLAAFPAKRRETLSTLALNSGAQWAADAHWPQGTVGRLMDKALAVFAPLTTIQEVIEKLRPVVRQSLITYIFVTDDQSRLLGVIAFRELLFATPEQTLADVMIRNPFSLRPDAKLEDAMREVVTRHYPVYPVCSDDGKLLGLVRGQIMFEQQAFEISAQAGSMVGVEKEERASTPWPRALKFRHPWLQLNLLTAFIAAAVVSCFQDTVNRIVLLAIFLPVLAGQCGNTGSQALAVTIRGMTLGELRSLSAWRLIAKEALLGTMNGFLVGLVAGAGMLFMAHKQHHPHALMLAAITVGAMTLSCFVSGVAGATTPMILKRLGADPATASSIFLSTATDVVSMGVFLSLATWLIPA
jgi:magnesium transporter